MQHARDGHRPRTTEQLDLFGASQSRLVARSPAWEALPSQARAELTALMTLLIVEHARACSAAAIGAEHDER